MSFKPISAETNTRSITKHALDTLDTWDALDTLIVKRFVFNYLRNHSREANIWT